MITKKSLTVFAIWSLSQFVYAGFEVRLDSNDTAAVPVTSNSMDKKNYTNSSELKRRVKIAFRGQCDSGKISKFGLKIGEYTHMFPGMNATKKSISGNNGQAWAYHDITGSDVLSQNNAALIQACNNYVSQQENMGVNAEQLLNSNFSVSNALSLPLKYTYHCQKKLGFSDSSGWAPVDELNIKALCKATGYTEPTEVKSKNFRIDKQVTLGGVCRVVLKGAIESSKPNQVVRFRFEHIDEDFKKKLSEVHQVRTDQQGYASYMHQYNVANGPGRERGKMRVLGVNHEFQSAQKNYNMNCNEGGPNTVQQVTPSTLSLEVKPVKNSKKPFGNQICPTKVKVVGKLKAGSDINGQAVFIGETLLNTEAQAFSVTKGQTKKFTRILNLPWSAPSTTTLATGGGIASPLMKQNVMQGLNIVGENSQAPILSVPRKAYPISCSHPSVNPGVQIPNGGLNTLPNHTGGGAPTDMQGNTHSTNRTLPRKDANSKPKDRKQ
jgi:hypothetical protein